MEQGVFPSTWGTRTLSPINCPRPQLQTFSVTLGALDFLEKQGEELPPVAAVRSESSARYWALPPTLSFLLSFERVINPCLGSSSINIARLAVAYGAGPGLGGNSRSFVQFAASCCAGQRAARGQIAEIGLFAADIGGCQWWTSRNVLFRHVCLSLAHKILYRCVY
ncbi:unnamed protein product [Linum trigynum]|uniref:Uncharacterized protein n=1 Tax=Linum trigynum TaxID=586398 RepID=A0AAV2FRG8_9ROSI